jgi:hypothetical protein
MMSNHIPSPLAGMPALPAHIAAAAPKTIAAPASTGGWDAPVASPMVPKHPMPAPAPTQSWGAEKPAVGVVNVTKNEQNNQHIDNSKVDNSKNSVINDYRTAVSNVQNNTTNETKNYMQQNNIQYNSKDIKEYLTNYNTTNNHTTNNIDNTKNIHNEMTNIYLELTKIENNYYIQINNIHNTQYGPLNIDKSVEQTYNQPPAPAPKEEKKKGNNMLLIGGLAAAAALFLFKGKGKKIEETPPVVPPETPKTPPEIEKKPKPKAEVVSTQIKMTVYGDPIIEYTLSDGTKRTEEFTKDSTIYGDKNSELFLGTNDSDPKYAFADEMRFKVNGSEVYAGKDGKVTVAGKEVAIGGEATLPNGGSVKVTAESGRSDGDFKNIAKIEIKAPNEKGDGFENITAFLRENKRGLKMYEMNVSKTSAVDNAAEQVDRGLGLEEFKEDLADQTAKVASSDDADTTEA